MKKLLSLLALFALGFCNPVYSASPDYAAGSINTISNTQGLTGILQAQAHGGWRVIGRSTTWTGSVSSNAGTDSSCTTRTIYTTAGAVSTLKLHFLNSNPVNTIDCNGFNPVIMRASIEYPLGTAVQQLAVAGQTTWVVGGDNPGAWTDPVGIVIPAGTQFAVRAYVRVAVPPTSPVASLVSGGSLSTSSTYYYKVTAIDNGIESGPTSEVSVAPTTGNQTINVTWTLNSNASAYRVYRSTSTGTEVYLATVNGPTAQFLDTGALTAGTSTPPAAQKFCFTRYLQTGDSCNAQYAAGNGADATGTTGALSVTASNTYGVTPDVILGDDVSSVTIAGFGDSIMSNNGTSPINPWTGNWFERGITTGTNSSVNLSISAAKVSDFATQGASGTRWRLAQLPYADYVISGLGTNDIYSGTSWTTTATNQLLLAKICNLRGQRYVITTLLPRTTNGADNFVTIANQTTSGTYETPRENYNTWVRNGCQVSGGTPVLTGGTPSPYVYATFDATAQVEVNASNVLTTNGGFWRVPSAATLTGQVATGTPTTTSIQITGAAYTSNQYKNYVLVCTGGTAGNLNIGRLISANTTTTFTVAAFPNTPAAGDTFAVYQVYTTDGTHPTDTGHSTVGTAFASWITSNVSAFAAP